MLPLPLPLPYYIVGGVHYDQSPAKVAEFCNALLIGETPDVKNVSSELISSAVFVFVLLNRIDLVDRLMGLFPSGNPLVTVETEESVYYVSVGYVLESFLNDWDQTYPEHECIFPKDALDTFFSQERTFTCLTNMRVEATNGGFTLPTLENIVDDSDPIDFFVDIESIKDLIDM